MTRNPEADVLDAIDELVDEQIAAGPQGEYYWTSDAIYEPCRWCGNEFHGLPKYRCPGSTAQGPLPSPIGAVPHSGEIVGGPAVVLGTDITFWGVLDADDAMDLARIQAAPGALHSDSVQISIDPFERLQAMIQTMMEVLSSITGINLSLEEIENIANNLAAQRYSSPLHFDPPRDRVLQATWGMSRYIPINIENVRIHHGMDDEQVRAYHAMREHYRG